MKLYGTPPSHFTRKVRVTLQELGVACEFVPLTQLMDTEPDHFAGNPLLQYPVLEDEGRRLFESDLICEYLLEKHGRPSSPMVYLPRGDRFEHLRRLSVINGGMAAGVKIIRAKRSGIASFEKYVFFQQEAAALAAALRWLDQDLGDRVFYGPGAQLSLLDVSLMCFVEWALFREMAANLNSYPNLARFIAAHRERPAFAATHPSREAL